MALSAAGCQGKAQESQGTPEVQESQTHQETTESQDTTAAGQEAEGIYTPGTYTASAQGFGGTVTVTMTFDESSVTDVTIDAPDETEAIGGEAAKSLAEVVKMANGGEFDGVSGAAVTSKAVQAAVEDCIAQAKGESSDTAGVKMTPGTYTGYAESFYAHDGITVEVEVSETEILSIKADQENTSDMSVILQSVVDKMVPRMIENQSVSVDSITGATVSSNAVKAATESALVEALVAGGSDESAIKNFYVTPEKKGGQEPGRRDRIYHQCQCRGHHYRRLCRQRRTAGAVPD